MLLFYEVFNMFSNDNRKSILAQNIKNKNCFIIRKSRNEVSDFSKEFGFMSSSCDI